jgi:iron complex transport system substrate-binding protein
MRLKRKAIYSLIIGLIISIPVFPAEQVKRETVDEMGRRITYHYPPRRIISLAPNLTEILFSLEAGDLIVGVSDMCDFPEQAKGKPKIGGFSPSIERIVSLSPDIVFATTAGTRMETVAKLENLGIPVFVTRPGDASSIANEIELIGELIGRGKQGEEEADRFRKRIEWIKNQLSGSRRVKLLYLIWHKPLMAPGGGTFLSDAIEISGGESITSSASLKLVRLSPEEMVSGEPEVVFFPEIDKAEILKFKERWHLLPAVKNGRIYTINEDLILRPGPRIILGIEEMARILHPECFKEEKR